MMNKQKRSARKERLKQQTANNYRRWLESMRDNFLRHMNTSDNPEYFKAKATYYDKLAARVSR